MDLFCEISEVMICLKKIVNNNKDNWDTDNVGYGLQSFSVHFR
jgi:hypothetical protein